MYILNLCEISGVLRAFYILKIALNITLTVLPIIVIITTMISMFKVVTDGKAETLKQVLPLATKKIIAAIIVFIIPAALNFVFSSLVDMGVDFASCWTKANLEGVNSAALEEEQKLKEEKEQRKKEIEEAMKEREALEAAKSETIKQEREEYNNGGNLEGEVLSTGTSGTYFAPLQGSGFNISGSSVTGGCSNNSPVYHDLSIREGTPVYAPYDGTAKYIQSNCNGVLYSYGNQVRVYKDDGTFIIYAHFSRFPDGISMPISADCKDNASHKTCGAGHCNGGMTSTTVATVTVKKGQLIGYTGNSGNSAGPHLHVEIHEGGSKSCVTDPWAAFGMR